LSSYVPQRAKRTPGTAGTNRALLWWQCQTGDEPVDYQLLLRDITANCIAYCQGECEHQLLAEPETSAPTTPVRAFLSAARIILPMAGPRTTGGGRRAGGGWCVETEQRRREPVAGIRGILQQHGSKAAPRPNKPRAQRPMSQLPKRRATPRPSSQSTCVCRASR
jgi:hypothetical protein